MSHPGKAILVVDDEDAIRMLARRILEPEGYRVFEASNGVEALNYLSANGELDLLVADLQMPILRGDEMARRFRMRRPDLKVLFVSGYVDSLLDGQPVLWEGEAFLEKPITSRGLREAVSLLLFGSIHRPVPRGEKPASAAPVSQHTAAT
jgi:two-component system cell cycle sensor histidine kinase/response regulator CckA